MTILFLLDGCGSNSTTTVDSGVDGPRAISDGAIGTTSDLAQDASHDGPLATDGVGRTDSAGQVDVPGNADAGILGSPDLAVSRSSDDTSVPFDTSSDAQSASDGPANIDVLSVTGTDAFAADSSLGTGDAAAPSDVGSDGTTGPGNKIGVIALSETSEILPAPIGAIVASGAQATFGLQAGKSSCNVTTAGDCQLFVCTAASNPTPTFLPAGTVTITGLTTNVSLNPMQGSTGAAYMSTSYSGYLWTSSRLATVVVTGSADVPAFTMDLTAPNPITVTSPLPGSDMSYTISRSSDLAVAWSGGVDGSVQVNLSSNSSGATQSSTITCNVDAAKGTVTVPASLMSGFASSGSFVAGAYSSATKNVGDWLMEFQAAQQTGTGTAKFTN